MEEKTPQAAAPAAPPSQAPTMDVVAPHAAATEQVAVQPAPPGDAADSSKANPSSGSDLKKKEAAKTDPKKPAVPKRQKNGVGVAIFATIIIVLGLGAMATYAFLKTQN